MWRWFENRAGRWYKLATFSGEALPFQDKLLLEFHYEKHRNEFNFASAAEYEAAADAFMSGQAKTPARECHRGNGDRVRFNRRSEYLAVQAPSGFLKTFHKPSAKYRDRGFFMWECGRTDIE